MKKFRKTWSQKEPFTHKLVGLSPSDKMLVTLGKYRAGEEVWIVRDLQQCQKEGYRRVRIEEVGRKAAVT